MRQEKIKLWKTEIVIKHQWATKKKCQELWYASGCDPRCLAKLKSMWGIWRKRAALAKALCKMAKHRKK